MTDGRRHDDVSHWVVDVQAFIDAQPLSALQKRLLLSLLPRRRHRRLRHGDHRLHRTGDSRVSGGWTSRSSDRCSPPDSSGLMLGAFAVGPLADRHGRKTMLVASMIVFGAASLASAFSGGLTSLIWLRFLTGLGLGGAMPMTITLASEFCPTARRSSLVTLMFCGFTIGSAMAGFIAARVLPGLRLARRCWSAAEWRRFFSRRCSARCCRSRCATS